MIYKDDYYLFFIIQMPEIIWKTENNQFDLFKFFMMKSKKTKMDLICGRLYILLYSTTRR
jgi:hypothetical protein